MKPRIFHSEKSLMNSILLTSFHRTARTPPGHSGLFPRLSGLYLFKLLIPAWANSPGFIRWKGVTSGSFQPTFVTLGCSLQPELLFWLPVDQVFEGESKSQNHQEPLIKALSDPSSFVQHHHKFNSQAKLNDDKLLNLSWHLSWSFTYGKIQQPHEQIWDWASRHTYSTTVIAGMIFLQLIIL